MHITLLIKATTIERNQVNKELLATYQNARKKSRSSEDKRPDEDRAIRLPGVIPRLKEIIEGTTPWIMGAKCTVFDETKVLLDPAAEILLSEYLNFLNTIVMKAKLGPTDTENGALSKPEVVVRDILYRLAAELLSIVDEDKNALLTGISLFIEDIAKQSTFTEKKYWFFGNEIATTFLNELIYESKNRWFPAFSNAIKGQGILKLNQTVIARVISDIKTITFDVEACLCAYFDRNQPAENLASNGWISSLLGQYESQYEVDATYVVVGYSDERVVYQEKILEKINTDKGAEVGAKMKEFYQLLTNLIALQDLLVLTAQFIESTGWIAILRDIFNFHKLSKLIKGYYDTRDLLLIELEYLKGTSAGLGITRRVQFQQTDIEMTSLSALKMLDDEGLKKHIRATLFLNAQQLLNFQNYFCQPQFKYINESIINDLNALLMPSKKLEKNEMVEEIKYLKEQVALKDKALELLSSHSSSSVTTVVSSSYKNSQALDINYLCLAAQHDDKVHIFSDAPTHVLDNIATDKKYIGSTVSQWIGPATPLVVAVAYGNRQVISKLLEKEVNPFILCGGFRSWTATEILTHNVVKCFVDKPEEIIEQLKKYEIKYSQEIAKYENTQVVRPLVEDACRAVYSENISWLETLVKQRCNFNGTAVSYGERLAGFDRLIGKKDRTPLALAAEKESKEVVKFLVGIEDLSMIDPHITCGVEKLTALDYAKQTKNKEIITLITDYIERYKQYKEKVGIKKQT